MTSRPLYDRTGTRVLLGRRLGSGGEGDVFELQDDAGSVAKVYKAPAAPEKAEKLGQMVMGFRQELSPVAAWPRSTIHDRPGGRVVGIVMPKVSGYKEIHLLYGPKSRNIEFPKADWRFLVHVARNAAAAFHTIHSFGYVIGDVNEGNLLVGDSGLLRFIDCDSFQVQVNGRVYKCGVGVAQYTPPELQGKAFDSVIRTENHDRFGLAVLLFHLLMMGRHPFSGVYRGKGDMPVEAAISEFRFAYGPSAPALQMEPPPTAPPVNCLPPPVMALFERSFSRHAVTGSLRPSAMDWFTALSSLEQRLKTCGSDHAHKFSAHRSACPWCEMSARGISTLFISASLRLGAVHSGFNVHVAWETMERAATDLGRHVRANVELQWTAPAPWLESETHQVKALEGRLHRIARELECIPQYTDDEKAVLRTLEEELKKAIAATSAHMGFSALLMSIAFGALLLAMLGPLLGVPMFFGIVIGVVFGVWCFVYLATSTHRPVQMAIRTKIDGLESRCEGRRHARRQSCIDEQRRTAAEIERVDHERLSRIEAAELKRERAAARVDSAKSRALRCIDQMRAGMLALRREYESLDSKLKQEMVELEQTAEQRQRDAFLDRQHILLAQISGIGAARKQTLLSFGVETAFDVTEVALSRIPGFGPYLVGEMMSWKGEVARRFKFDRSKGVPHSDKAQLHAKYAGIRRGIEGRLDNGEKEIHAIRVEYEKEIRGIRESVR